MEILVNTSRIGLVRATNAYEMEAIINAKSIAEGFAYHRSIANVD